MDTPKLTRVIIDSHASSVARLCIDGHQRLECFCTSANPEAVGIRLFDSMSETNIVVVRDITPYIPAALQPYVAELRSLMLTALSHKVFGMDHPTDNHSTHECIHVFSPWAESYRPSPYRILLSSWGKTPEIRAQWDVLVPEVPTTSSVRAAPPRDLAFRLAYKAICEGVKTITPPRLDLTPTQENRGAKKLYATMEALKPLDVWRQDITTAAQILLDHWYQR